MAVVGTAVPIRNGVVERALVGRAHVGRRAEGHTAIELEGGRAIGRVLDGGDRQGVALDVAVVAQNVDHVSGAVLEDGRGVVGGVGRVVDAGDGDVDRRRVGAAVA